MYKHKAKNKHGGVGWDFESWFWCGHVEQTGRQKLIAQKKRGGGRGGHMAVMWSLRCSFGIETKCVDSPSQAWHTLLLFLVYFLHPRSQD